MNPRILKLMMMVFVAFSFPAFAFDPCQKFLGGGGGSRSNIWEKIALNKTTTSELLAIEFFRELAKGESAFIRFKMDPPDDPRSMVRSYHNSWATHIILAVLAQHHQRVFVGNKVGYIQKAELNFEDNHQWIDFVLSHDRLGKDEPFELRLETYNSTRGIHDYQFGLGEALRPEIKSTVTNSRADAIRLFYHATDTYSATAIDRLNTQGRVDIEAASYIQARTIDRLSHMGFNVEVSQGRKRFSGLLMGRESVSGGPLTLETSAFLIRVLKANAQKDKECESQFTHYATVRTRFSSSFEQQEYIRLRALCTDELVVQTDQPLILETW